MTKKKKWRKMLLGVFIFSLIFLDVGFANALTLDYSIKLVGGEGGFVDVVEEEEVSDLEEGEVLGISENDEEVMTELPTTNVDEKKEVSKLSLRNISIAIIVLVVAIGGFIFFGRGGSKKSGEETSGSD